MKQEISLIKKLECLKTNWYVWECRVETESDSRLATVQADFAGNLVAEDSLEYEEYED